MTSSQGTGTGPAPAAPERMTRPSSSGSMTSYAPGRPEGRLTGGVR